MRVARAVFIRLAKDMLRSPVTLVMFLLFPAVAFIMTRLIALPNDDIPNNMFVAMMGPIFAGMGLITSASAVIAEDIEQKSLRFLILAGVKPHQYLIGTGGFFLLAGTVTSGLFALMGDFTFAESMKFMAVMVSGTAASILLGTAIGMWSKNQQSATGFVMPAAMVIGFTPMIATFDETVERIASVLYTQQLNVVVNDFSASLLQPMLVIAANIAVFACLFIFAYVKKGLKG